MSQLRIGIIGLPNAGKSTLFNALLGRQIADTAPYPFCTIEPNVGVVPVPDQRLADLVQIVRADHSEANPKVTPAVVEFFDIAGLVKGASQGEGLGNQFLHHIREVDALVHVVRDFASDTVVATGVNPKDDIETVNTELLLKDLETLNKQVVPNHSLKLTPEEQFFYSGLTKLKTWLGEGKLAIDCPLTPKERAACQPLNLLTFKPVIYALNVNETQLFNYLQTVSTDDLFLPICAKLEQDLNDLTDEEQRLYLQELGLAQTGLARLISRCYKLLSLISFLTAGPKEARAWSIKSGTKAPQAGGTIHSDFEQGFIRAVVVSFDQLKQAGSFSSAKSQGWVREEGKEYTVEDGDVVEFRFNI